MKKFLKFDFESLFISEDCSIRISIKKMPKTSFEIQNEYLQRNITVQPKRFRQPSKNIRVLIDPFSVCSADVDSGTFSTLNKSHCPSLAETMLSIDEAT